MRLIHIINTDEYYISQGQRVASIEGSWIFLNIEELLCSYISSSEFFFIPIKWQYKIEEEILFEFETKEEIINKFPEYLI